MDSKILSEPIFLVIKGPCCWLILNYGKSIPVIILFPILRIIKSCYPFCTLDHTNLFSLSIEFYVKQVTNVNHNSWAMRRIYLQKVPMAPWLHICSLNLDFLGWIPCPPLIKIVNVGELHNLYAHVWLSRLCNGNNNSCLK